MKTNQVTLLQSSPCFDIFLCLIKVHTSLSFSKKLDNFKIINAEHTTDSLFPPDEMYILWGILALDITITDHNFMF